MHNEQLLTGKDVQDRLKMQNTGEISPTLCALFKVNQRFYIPEVNH